MKTRLPGTVFLLVLMAFVLAGSLQFDAGLRDIAIISGWTLAILSLLLATYNLRKKISSVPIGRAWYWRKAHSFLGWLAVVVFFVHAGPLPPDGQLYLLLWLLYFLLLVSGITGLWLSLALPSHIAQGGERLQYERIPLLREAQSRRAEQVILAASVGGVGQPLMEFHNLHLRPYLCQFRERYRHCVNNAKIAGLLLQELKNIGRYVDSGSRQSVAELEEIIAKKQILDRQYALQGLLKKWIYFHIALNYMSWAFIVIHVFASYTFRLEYGL